VAEGPRDGAPFEELVNSILQPGLLTSVSMAITVLHRRYFLTANRHCRYVSTSDKYSYYRCSAQYQPTTGNVVMVVRAYKSRTKSRDSANSVQTGSDGSYKAGPTVLDRLLNSDVRYCRSSASPICYPPSVERTTTLLQ